MNIVLWILQVLLAIVFGLHGWLLVSPPDAEMLRLMNEQMGSNFRIFLGIAELLAVAGLLLPGITRILPWLTTVTAACLMIVMSSATVLHLYRGEISSAIITAVIFVLVTWLAYMRWKVKPLPARSAISRSAI